MNPRVRAVARPVVLALNTPFARRRTTGALGRAPRPLRLEIGGTAARPGWLVTNVHPTARHYLDATRTWPIESGAVELVYADNVIEHVPLQAGRTMLAEAHRCLRPGGTLRLVTPDLRKHVEEYLRGAEAVSGTLAEGYRGMGLPVEHAVDLLRIPVAMFEHHVGYVYDVAALSAELERAGFVDVRECALGHSDVPALRDLDSRVEEGPAQMALEARRA